MRPALSATEIDLLSNLPPGYWRSRSRGLIKMEVMEATHIRNVMALLGRSGIETSHPIFVAFSMVLKERWEVFFNSIVVDPPADEIAEILKETRATTCVHGYDTCVALCGVEAYGPNYMMTPMAKYWRPISFPYRIQLLSERASLLNPQQGPYEIRKLFNMAML